MKAIGNARLHTGMFKPRAEERCGKERLNSGSLPTIFPKQTLLPKLFAF